MARRRQCAPAGHRNDQRHKSECSNLIIHRPAVSNIMASSSAAAAAANETKTADCSHNRFSRISYGRHKSSALIMFGRIASGYWRRGVYATEDSVTTFMIPTMHSDVTDTALRLVFRRSGCCTNIGYQQKRLFKSTFV